MSRFFGGIRRTFKGHGRTMLKLFVYSIGCVITLLWLVTLIGNVVFFADRTSYQAELEDVTGLVVNDEVKVAGVGVGKVTGISTERGKAVVSFSIEDDVVLRSGAQAGVRWRNVLGQKYLYVYPSSEGRVLESGDRLPIEQALPSSDIGEFLNAIGPVLQAIDPADANAFVEAMVEALQGNEARVRTLLSSTATVADTVGGLDTEVGRIIVNLEDVIGAIASRDDSLDTVLSNLATLSTDLAERNDSLQSLVVNFSEVQTHLNNLVTENRGNIDGSIDDLQVIAGVLSQHREDLDQALATLPEGTAPYHYISAYGQWFQVRVVVACLANQQSCAREDVTSGLLIQQGPGGQNTGSSVTDILNFALSSEGTP